MFNVKLKPARQTEDPAIKIVCDFDQLLSFKPGFKFNGKTYVLQDVTVENYMQTTQAYNDLIEVIDARSQGKLEMTEEEVYRTYYSLIHAICPEFPYDELLKMPFKALTHLIALILKTVGGEMVGSESEKKKDSNPARIEIKLVPLIAFACHFYSWSFQEVMAMPLKAFFNLYKEAIKIQAQEYREQLDISMAPATQFVYYKNLRSKYNSFIYTGPKKLPEKPSSYVIDAGSDEAREFMFGVFRALKRSRGYG